MKNYISNSFLIFAAYIFVFYFIPYLLFINFESVFQREFRPSVEVLTIFSSVLVVSFGYFVSFFSIHSCTKNYIFDVRDINYLNSNYFLIFKSIIFLVISIYFFIFIGTSYRQTGLSLSGYGYLGFISLFCLAYLKTEIIFDLISFLNGKKLSLDKKIFKFFGTFVPISLLVSGAFSIPFVLVSFLLYFPLESFSKIFKLNFIKSIIIFSPAVLLMAFLIILVGFGNKYDFDVVLNSMLDPEFQNFMKEYIIWRLSIYFVSIQSVFDSLNAGIFDSYLSFKTSLELSFDRLGALMDLSVYQNEVRTIERLNFLYLFPQNDNYISGTSPGLVAGLLISGSAIFSIIYVLFSSVVISLLTMTLKNKITIFSSAMIMLYFLFLFDNPMKFLVFPEVELTQLLLFLLFFSFYFKIRKKNG